MSKYTSGPWSARYVEEEHAWRISDGYSEIGMGFGPANARLIASAPELLDALRGVLSVADRKTNEFDAARAAIAKAEGRDE